MRKNGAISVGMRAANLCWRPTLDPVLDTKIALDALQHGSINSALLQCFGDTWKREDGNLCEHLWMLKNDIRRSWRMQTAIVEVPSRLQCLFLCLLRYNVELHFVPGKQFVLANFLSHTFVGQPQRDEAGECIKVHAVSAVSSLVSDATLDLPNTRNKQ